MAYQNINKDLLTEIADQVERLHRVKAHPEKFVAYEVVHGKVGLVEAIESELAQLEEFLPSGSGFDSGTQIDSDSTGGKKIVFFTEFHHMDEAGSYDGWTDHKVIVTPTLSCSKFDIEVTGEDRNEIHEYIASEFAYAFEQRVASEFDNETGALAYRLSVENDS